MKHRLIIIIAILSLTACGGTSVVPILDGGGDDTADLLGEDLLRWDWSGQDADQASAPDTACMDCFGPDTTGCEGPGCFGEPCAENGDCNAGFCVDHMGDKVCTMECIEECPEGWSCQQVGGGPDVMFICISPFRVLCRPCVDDGDCTSAAGYEDACVDYEEGRFCGAVCTEDAPCPEGYACEEVETMGGGSSRQCVADAGLCECSDTSVALGLSTICEAVNEVGTCPGHRTCTDQGLTTCDAPTPSTELCDGADNDCDGDIDEDTCDDENQCTSDSCDPAAGCVHAPLNEGNCDDGDICTVTDHCAEGVCQGTAIECNDSNPCTDDMCDGVQGCSFTNNTADCDDGNPCTIGDSCKAGTCAGTAVPCDCLEDADCAELEDGDLCNGTLYCDKSGMIYQCKADPNTVISCPGPEGSDAPCLAATCDPFTGGCSLVPANPGAPCSDGDICTEGDACAGGACVGAGLKDCDDLNPCTVDACDPVAGCTHTPAEASCDDGNECTTGDHCAAGSCVSGSVLPCNDGNPCTTDSCNPQTGCVHEFNTAPCSDGSLCTSDDQCQAGTCVPGPELNCGDGNPCTDDICNPATGCLHVNNTGGCDDGDPCTEGDKCSTGACVGVTPKDCNDDNPCTDDLCIPMAGCSYVENQNPCDDGSLCTIGDHCNQGTCVSGTAQTCDDGNPCTDDSCDPLTGCVFAANDETCDDQNSCTTGDHCVGGACVGAGSLECDDSNPCTQDLCLPGGGCQHQDLDGAACSDEDPCTLGDLCNQGTCVPGAAMSCDDGNPCTDEACVDGACAATPNAADCDDDNPCTEGDHCHLGACMAAGPMLCDDNNVCTTDYCDPTSGCVFMLNDAPCNDGNLCTVNDACVAGGCQGGGPLSCADGNPCTDDTCDPLTGCSFTANNAPCDDQNECTEDDACSGGACQPGGAVDCDDGNLCTDDLCDTVDGCLHFANTVPCDDGDLCTNGDQCGDSACQPGVDMVCNDGEVCTADTCDPDSGCVFTAITPCCGNLVVEAGEECDDGNQSSGDGCDGSCQDETPSTAFQGFASWDQNVSAQSDATQDALMDSACASAHSGSRAATHQELVDGLITGLPGSNTSGDWCLFKCPDCAGSGGWSPTPISGHCRKCVDPGLGWPTSHGDPDWHDYCCQSSRTAVCIK